MLSVASSATILDMAETKMVNFRLRQEDIPRLNAAVKRSGMTRSDFIRKAVTELVAKMDGQDGELAPEGGRGKAKEPVATKGKFPDCPRNKACQVITLPMGQGKVCKLCAERW
jgi:hypothetical protein